MAGSEESSAEKGDKSKEEAEEQTLGQLMKRCNKAREELYSLLANPVVVDITRTKVEVPLAPSPYQLSHLLTGWCYEGQVHARYKCQKDEGNLPQKRGIVFIRDQLKMRVKQSASLLSG